MFKWIKRKILIKYTIFRSCISKIRKNYNLYQSNPKGFIIVLNAVYSVCEENFQVEGIPLCTGLQPDWIPLHDDARKLVYDVDLVSRVKDDENQFLDMILVLDVENRQYWMM